MKDFKDDTFLSRWINGQLSDEELTAFKESEEYPLYAKILQGAELIESPSFDEQRLLEKIKAEQTHVADTRTFNKRWIYSAAASVVLLVCFSAYFLFFRSDVTTYETGFGQKLTFTLPDGSEVILNANSSFTYSTGNWKENRELSLTGEGYFKVVKGGKFTVQTENGSVAVLGTQFTVKQLDDMFEVICFEGSVKVTSVNEEVILEPKTGVLKTRDRLFKKRLIELERPSWMDNKSSFQSVPMIYVLKEIENQFGVNIESNDLVDQYSYNGTFPHDDLNIALKLVLDPIDIQYVKKGNIIVLSNN